MCGVVILAFLCLFIPGVGPFLAVAVFICGPVSVGVNRINGGNGANRISTPSPQAIVEAELLRVTDPAAQRVLQDRLSAIKDAESKAAQDGLRAKVIGGGILNWYYCRNSRFWKLISNFFF
jgi:hypothetical protein